MTLVEFLKVSRPYWKILIITPILSLILTAWFSHRVSPEYEARATIEVGQIGRATIFEAKVEKPSETLNKMKEHRLIEAVLGEPSLNQISAKERLFLEKSFRVSPPPNSELIQLRVQAYSKESAKEFLNRAVAQVQKHHNGDIYEPYIQRLKTQLAKMAQELETLKREKKTNNTVKLSSASATLSMHEFVVNHWIEEITDRLESPQTFPTRILGEIEVSQEPIFPRKKTLYALGILIGFTLAASLSFFHFSYLRKGV